MANLTKWHIYGFVPPMGNTKVSHCATQWNILAFHLWLQHQVLVLNEFHTQVLKYFFQPLTSRRLSEAVSVSMVWMLFNYYSCSGRCLGSVRHSITQNLFTLSWKFNSMFGSSHSASYANQKWPTKGMIKL